MRRSLLVLALMLAAGCAAGSEDSEDPGAPAPAPVREPPLWIYPDLPPVTPPTPTECAPRGWSKRTERPLADDWGHPYWKTTTLPDGRVLFAGARDTEDPSRRAILVYDPTADSWTTIGSAVTARREHAQVLLKDGRVLLMGGETSSEYMSAHVEALTIGGEPFATARAPMLSRRLRPRAVVLPSGRVMVAGGMPYNDELPTEGVEIYDPASDRWTARNPPGDFLHPPKAKLCMTTDMFTMTSLSDGRVLVTGSNFKSECGRAFIYDESADTWTETTPLATAAAPSASLRLPDGRVVVLGGERCTAPEEICGERTTAVQVFDPSTNTWSALASTHVARSYADVTWLGCGGFLVTDGYFRRGHTYSLQHEYYDLATDQWTLAPVDGGGSPGCVPQPLADGSVLCTRPMMTFGP